MIEVTSRGQPDLDLVTELVLRALREPVCEEPSTRAEETDRREQPEKTS